MSQTLVFLTLFHNNCKSLFTSFTCALTPIMPFYLTRPRIQSTFFTPNSCPRIPPQIPLFRHGFIKNPQTGVFKSPAQSFYTILQLPCFALVDFEVFIQNLSHNLIFFHFSFIFLPFFFLFLLLSIDITERK